ncbi:MAG: hypothetical protein PHQ66_02585 [Candidatus Nanoarchaeia archaeon]|nr:hypothetical protein [Candidatus Nanoarchaeia archaeon]MDD5357746.1 hypothetical protein [Candidatus Nanoarchaeia archaeon]MDD5588665.1 hypothetical protein [Candidatus Nanoarchaeia archaeon]
MKTKKSLVSAIVLSTGILFGGCSKVCYDLPNEETVCIEESIGADALTVTKTDGRIIKYVYYETGDNPLPEYVAITKDKKTTEYRQKEVLDEAKKQIIEYYKRAKKDEVEQGLKDLQ